MDIVDNVTEIIYNCLRDAIFEPQRVEIDTAELSGEFSEIAEASKFLARSLSETKSYAEAIYRGEFEAAPPEDDTPLTRPLKSIAGALKQLTWQAQRVAQGDFRQFTDSFGELGVWLSEVVRQIGKRSSELVSELDRSRRLSRALEDMSELLESVAGDTSSWLCIVDRETGEWLFTNRSLAGIIADEGFEPQIRQWISGTTTEFEIDPATRSSELPFESRGVRQVLNATARLISWHGQPAAAFTLSDISKKSASAGSSFGAFRDALTRQYNRNYGMRLFEQWVAEGRSFAMSFVDIDNLKYVNEKFGSIEGDRYILTVATILRGFSSDVIVCRVSGDEFMLLADGWDRDRAEKHLSNLRQRLLRRNEDPSARYYHSMCYGIISTDGQNQVTASDLLSRADIDMRAFKAAHPIPRDKVPL